MSFIKNSDIEAKAEDIKQIIIDREINGVLWDTIFDKYGIYGEARQQVVKGLVNVSKKYINLMV